MKKLLVLCLTVLMLFGLGGIAGAKDLKLGLDAGPVSQDPQVQLSGGMLQYSHWVFDPLVRYAQDMSFEPRLAERWERIDDLTMRFYLRKGVKFHTGCCPNRILLTDTGSPCAPNFWFFFFKIFTNAQIAIDYTDYLC